MAQTYDWGSDYRKTLKREDTPARESIAITASASNLTRYVRSLWINTAGTVTGVLVDDATDVAKDYTVIVGPAPLAFRRITACPANTIGLI